MWSASETWPVTLFVGNLDGVDKSFEKTPTNGSLYLKRSIETRIVIFSVVNHHENAC